MALRRSLILWAGVLALSGCGGGRTFSPPCSFRATRLVSQELRIPPSGLAARRSIGNNGMPQCSFAPRAGADRRFLVIVNVDTSPQPYAVLTRTIVEGQQVFSPVRLVPAPVAVTGLGLLASWFPNQSQLMSTDGVRLIRTTVVWPAARQAMKIGFATRISRLYLGRSKPGLAKMYP